jgi:hypothetical protein
MCVVALEEQSVRLLSARWRPLWRNGARVHQRLDRARHESVVHEHVLVNPERRIATLQIARAVAFYAMPQRQVLRARRGADRVRLHEPELVEGTFQRDRSEEASGDGKAAEVVQRDQQCRQR